MRKIALYKKFALTLIFSFFSFGLFAQSTETAAINESDTLIAYAKTFIGTPYLFGGTTKQGMDCSGFIFTVVRDSLKITIPRTTTQLYKFASPISSARMAPGDLVFFKTTSANTVSHVGIFIGRNQFIHAASDGPNTGVIISSLNEAYWKRTYYSAGSFLSHKGPAQTAGDVFSNDFATTENAPQNKTTKNQTSRNDVLNGVAVETTVMGSWSLFNSSGFYPHFRGIYFSAGFLFNDIFGLNLGIRYDAALDSLMMPFTLQFVLGYGFRFFLGPAPNFKQESPLPVLAGFSWQIQFYENNVVKLAFIQDITYTFTDMISPQTYFSNFGSKLCFSTGIRISFPLDKR